MSLTLHNVTIYCTQRHVVITPGRINVCIGYIATSKDVKTQFNLLRSDNVKYLIRDVVSKNFTLGLIAIRIALQEQKLQLFEFLFQSLSCFFGTCCIHVIVFFRKRDKSIKQINTHCTCI